MMKKNKPVFLLIIVLILSGCKKDEIVNTPINNNEPVENRIILISPENNSTGNSFTQILKWEHFPNSVSYAVQLSMDANFISPAIMDSNINSLEITVPPGKLTTNIYYYWRVKSDLGSGNYSAWSDVYRFKIILTPPPPPVLLSPPNYSVNQPFLPLFDWDETPTTDIYRLQISVNPSFSTILLDTGRIPVSNLQCPYFYLITGTDYYWRVNAANSNGVSTGNWSEVFTFRTVNGTIPSSLNGTVTFTDGNFVPHPFFYVIAVFKTERWPPEQMLPDYHDSLKIKYVNNQFVADYSVRNIPNGNYHIAVYTTSRILTFTQKYKSVFGCDTSRVIFSTCPLSNPGTVTISNGNGADNINLLSWADSSKSIF